MREGLRSRAQLGNVSGSEGVVHEERVGWKNEAVDLGDEGLETPSLTVEEDKVELKLKEECNLDLNLSVSENIDLVENGSGKNCLSGGSSIVEADVDEMTKKQKGPNEAVLVGGRVLRSRLKGEDDKTYYNGGSDSVFSGNSRGHSGLEMIKVEKEREDGDIFADRCKNEMAKADTKKSGKRKLKRKRGRPPKVELKEQDQVVGQLPRKRGRPFKVDVELKEQDQVVDQLPHKRGRSFKVDVELKEQDQVVDQLPRKRGRPSKVDVELREQDQVVDQLPRKRGRPFKVDVNCENRLIKVAHRRKGKVGLQKGKKGFIKSRGTNGNAIDKVDSRKSAGNELGMQGFSLVKQKQIRKALKTENNVKASSLKSKNKNAESGRGKVKQLVRDQIKDRLSAAGWTVDYRPRNGREYNDAVYVSLDGKTHWSITLAYNRLKKHYEAGDGEGKVYGPGFTFTPIPEEDFKILTKVINKERKDKMVKRGAKGGKKVDGAKGGKKVVGVKRKMKRKSSSGNEDITSPNRMPVLVRDHKRHKTHYKKQCALLVRNAVEEIDSETEGYVPYSGKRTVLAWMIDLGTVLQNGKVHYMNYGRKSAMLGGKITGDGIHCGCCDKIVTIADFEVHAGSDLSDPLKNIYTEEGTSLFQCLLDSWNKQGDSERKGFHFVDVAGEDPNDDTCGVCGDGGNLICCDGCPSTFHQGCLDIKNFPSGDWHCIYCCCKFCGSVDGRSNQRDGCDELTVLKLLTCELCEEKYHRSCIKANGASTDDSSEVFFCGNGCQELSKRLEMLLGVKHDIGDGFSWTFIRRSDVNFDTSLMKSQMVECNSKLAVALSIMDECFMPYIDHRSRINLIHGILYNCGSNFKRLNYSGFVTVILERGDEIISAASIRIHGNRLAEMPFIGTRYMYRRQGMCRRLLNAIEWALSSLNVELLVIPAISELRETWTSVFGFEPLELTNKQMMNNMSLLVFPHVDMLQKRISKNKFTGEILIPSEVVAVSNLEKKQIANDCSEAGSYLINDETISIESGRHLPEGLLSNNVPDIDSNTVDLGTSSKDATCQVVCQAVHENLVMEDNGIGNLRDCVIDTCYRTEHLNRDEKAIDLNCQLNNCSNPYEERCHSVSCISTEATEGHCVGALSEVTENFPSHVKVAYKVISNNIYAENSAPCDAESIPLDSQIVFSPRESKDSADSIYHDSCKISDSCGQRSTADCVQLNFIGSKVHTESVDVSGSHSGAVPTTNVRSQNLTKDIPGNCEKNSGVTGAQNPDEMELCSAKIPDLQSIPAYSGEKRADGVNVTSKASCVAEAHLLPADIEPAEADSLVDQTTQSNAPSLWSPNTDSGAALHWAPAGSASCGGTEGIALSNQAS
ncbi:hypothetical protein RJT34_22648 [Clitoria ternatea]|uniref:Uncharacterized protein n=1 Tax=Clitoria ternatea TaxID=43366 RepID=A0AAN9FRC8_CLITE